jgi:hypothetical protein
MERCGEDRVVECLADKCATVLDKRHVHPRVRRAICSSSLRRGGYGVVGGRDEERGRGGEEQGEMRMTEGGSENELHLWRVIEGIRGH